MPFAWLVFQGPRRTEYTSRKVRNLGRAIAPGSVELPLRRSSMKVRCDSAYATLLRDRYRGRLWVRWQNGLMTLEWLILDLSGVCEE